MPTRWTAPFPHDASQKEECTPLRNYAPRTQRIGGTHRFPPSGAAATFFPFLSRRRCTYGTVVLRGGPPAPERAAARAAPPSDDRSPAPLCSSSWHPRHRFFLRGDDPPRPAVTAQHTAPLRTTAPSVCSRATLLVGGATVVVCHAPVTNGDGR